MCQVMTPNMFSLDLWEISGHAAKYKEDMFLLDVVKQTFGLKPMNCPGHCVMFRERARSYRELPMRYADFGVLHRNELSGNHRCVRSILESQQILLTSTLTAQVP